MMGIEGNDAMAIATIFCLYEEQVLKVEGKVTEVSPNRVVKQSTRYPFQNLPWVSAGPSPSWRREWPRPSTPITN